MPRPMAVDISSSRLRISVASSWLFFIWGAPPSVLARATNASCLVEWFRKTILSGDKMFRTWTILGGVLGLELEERRSFTHFSISLFLKRHTVPIFPEGISPFCAQSYTVRSDTRRYFATSSIVRISSITWLTSIVNCNTYQSLPLFCIVCRFMSRLARGSIEVNFSKLQGWGQLVQRVIGIQFTQGGPHHPVPTGAEPHRCLSRGEFSQHLTAGSTGSHGIVAGGGHNH